MSNGMSLAQLIAAVYTETNRPDLVAETQQAVFSSTLKMHGLDYFARDITPAQVVFDAYGFIQELDMSAFPLFRKMSYFRKDDPSAFNSQEVTGQNNLPPLNLGISGYIVNPSMARNLITIMEPDELFDEYRAERLDVGYLAGDNFLIKSSTSFKYALAAWYSWPNCDIGNNGAAYRSWVAAKYPYAIIYDAASSILQKIGMTDAARKYDSPADPRDPMNKGGLVQVQIAMIFADNLVTGAH